MNKYYIGYTPVDNGYVYNNTGYEYYEYICPNCENIILLSETKDIIKCSNCNREFVPEQYIVIKTFGVN